MCDPCHGLAHTQIRKVFSTVTTLARLWPRRWDVANLFLDADDEDGCSTRHRVVEYRAYRARYHPVVR